MRATQLVYSHQLELINTTTTTNNVFTTPRGISITCGYKIIIIITTTITTTTTTTILVFNPRDLYFLGVGQAY